MADTEKKKDFSSGHVPSSVVYGPVLSRRFGKSLGVSMSLENGISCGWRCPYCQLGEMEYLDEPSYVTRADLQAQLAAAQERLDPSLVDVLCVSGSGEPFDHPERATLFQDIEACAKALDARVVVLTNGDALFDNLMQQSDIPDEWLVYYKWDVMSQTGAWRGMTAEQQASRIDVLKSIPYLRIQAMVFGMEKKSAAWHSECIENWCTTLAALNPAEVHLMSLERTAPRFKLLKYDRVQMEAIADQLRAHTDTIGTTVAIY